MLDALVEVSIHACSSIFIKERCIFALLSQDIALNLITSYIVYKSVCPV